MNLERMHRGCHLRLVLTLTCCFASLAVGALVVFLPAEAPAQCTVTNPNPNPNPNPASFVSPGDFNGDCKSDILWQNGTTGQLYTWLMNGAATLSQTTPGGATAPWGIVGVGDFDGDGKADIMWQNSSTGQLYLWTMNGASITSQVSPGTVNTAWAIVGVGDFNGDGKADLLWQNASTGQLYLWLMNGASITSQINVGTVASGWDVVGIGDFNGDGMADILWQNVASGQLYIWTMNGGSITSQLSPGTVSSVWAVLGIGDFDGNGTSDILWQNSSTGQTYIWLMNGASITSQLSPGTASPPQSVECANDGCTTVMGNGWTIVGIGDYDGSGRADILWQNLTSGQTYIWFMNGASITNQLSPGTAAAPWQVVTLPPFGCWNSVLCGMLSGINGVRANGPFEYPSPDPQNPSPAETAGGPLNPLVWDPGAAAVAASWAAQCNFGHNLSGHDGGENIDYIATGSSPVTFDALTQPESDWGYEVQFYTYSDNSCSGTCGHYTQLVWRNTTGVGCAVQQCPSPGPGGPYPWAFIVCDFTPPGNYPWQPY